MLRCFCRNLLVFMPQTFKVKEQDAHLLCCFSVSQTERCRLDRFYSHMHKTSWNSLCVCVNKLWLCSLCPCVLTIWLFYFEGLWVFYVTSCSACESRTNFFTSEVTDFWLWRCNNDFLKFKERSCLSEQFVMNRFSCLVFNAVCDLSVF